MLHICGGRIRRHEIREPPALGGDYLLHPSDNSIVQHDLDAVGMVRRVREDSLDDSFGKLPGPLILLLNNAHTHAGLDIGSVLAGHFDN